MTQTLNGSCHCGAVHVQLDPGKPVAELALRACQCSFCRRQGRGRPAIRAAACTSPPLRDR
jgi:hypothetical protein